MVRSKRIKKLKFKEEYGRKILKGKKASTIRLYTSLKVGDKVELISGNKRIGYAKIISVEWKKLRDLTDDEAIKDGFMSKRELIKALKKIYKGKVSKNTKVAIIHFEKE